MGRIVRAKCPGCAQALEIADAAPGLQQITCPSCNKLFGIRIPAAPSASVPVAKPVRPVATPPISQGTSAPTNIDLSSIDLNSPAMGVPVRSASGSPGSAASYEDARAGEVYDPFAAMVYKPKRKKQSNAAAIKIGLIVAAVVVIAVPLTWGLVRIGQSVASGDFTLSLLPDSHSSLFDDYWAFFTTAGEMPDFSGEDGKQRILQLQRSRGEEAEQLLRRALRLGKASRDDREKLHEKLRTWREEAISKAKALQASGNQPPTPAGYSMGELEQVFGKEEFLQLIQIIGATQLYLVGGIFDLPEPQTQAEQVYYEEADIVRDYFAVLESIGTPRAAAAKAAGIDALSKQVLELGVRRSKLPKGGYFEEVQKEYGDIDHAFEETLEVLQVMLRRDQCMVPELEAAMSQFALARSLLLQGARGVEESKLREAFAAAPSQRELAAKKAAEAEQKALAEANRTRKGLPRETIDELAGSSQPSVTQGSEAATGSNAASRSDPGEQHASEDAPGNELANNGGLPSSTPGAGGYPGRRDFPGFGMGPPGQPWRGGMPPRGPYGSPGLDQPGTGRTNPDWGPSIEIKLVGVVAKTQAQVVTSFRRLGLINYTIRITDGEGLVRVGCTDKAEVLAQKLGFGVVTSVDNENNRITIDCSSEDSP